MTHTFKDYVVSATVVREADGWSTMRQVPTFILPVHLGLVSQEHAERVAREMLNPFGDESITVHACAY